MLYGYARVSSKDQNEGRQIAALMEFGVNERDIYIEKRSGRDFDRDVYKEMKCTMQQGDALVILSIDRLGRNYEEILDEWREITKEMHCDIVVINMPLLDTRNNKDLTGTLIADIVLQLLSYVAETERRNIRQRQAEGIKLARENGVKFGRQPMERPEAFEETKREWEQGLISARTAGCRLGVTHKTFLKWARA